MFRLFTTTALVFALWGAALGQDEASSPELKHEIEELRGQASRCPSRRASGSRRAPTDDARPAAEGGAQTDLRLRPATGVT